MHMGFLFVCYYAVYISCGPGDSPPGPNLLFEIQITDHSVFCQCFANQLSECNGAAMADAGAVYRVSQSEEITLGVANSEQTIDGLVIFGADLRILLNSYKQNNREYM